MSKVRYDCSRWLTKILENSKILSSIKGIGSPICSHFESDTLYFQLSILFGTRAIRSKMAEEVGPNQQFRDR